MRRARGAPAAVKSCLRFLLASAGLLLLHAAVWLFPARAQEPVMAPAPGAGRVLALARANQALIPALITGINPGSPVVSPAHPQEPVIVQRIEFVGNRRIPKDTLRGRILTRDGDAYNEDILRRDFLALWNTQFFEDVRMEVEDSPDRPNAKVVVFHVRERPVIRRIRYCPGIPRQVGETCTPPVLTESEILERYKERKVGLSVESQFDPTRIKRAEVVLKELLGERGRQFAEIRPVFERIPATNAVQLTFFIEPGPKVKVGIIKIEGNQAFSDHRIIRSMRHSRPFGFPVKPFDFSVNVMSKTFDRRKLSEDQEIGIRGLYQDNGYFRVLVQDPILETVDVQRGGLPGPWPFFGRRRGKRTNITIPIEEGDIYKLNRLFVRSSDPDKGLFFKTDFLQAVFPLRQGQVFDVSKVRKSLETYQKLYGEWGFIDFSASPDVGFDLDKKEINLTLDFNEGKQFFVRRIEFQGNTTTRDKVIRREILLDEGDLFNSRYWEVSLLRINQLDYFDEIKAEHADIRRNVKDGSVDILLKVKEKGKQSIGLTGGVSGIAGSFVGLNYQTNNFLGLGETLTFSAEFGDRQRNFLFGFTEPYFMDRPISSGFTLFSSRFSFDQARETSLLIGQRIELDPQSTQNYDQDSTGFTMFASYPLRRFAFTRIGATYALTRSSIKAFSDASRLIFENVQFRNFAGPSAVEGILSSKIQPSITHNTVNHPINPTGGKSFFYSMGFEGGPLGGNVNTITQVFETKYFRPINKRRNVLGFRLLMSHATGYGGQVLPPYNRFYLGGEDTVRGFDIRTITPVAFIPVQTNLPITYQVPNVFDANGNPVFASQQVPVLDYSITFPGGDTQAVGNAEYRIPLVGPVGMSIFFDVGINGIFKRGQLRMNQAGLDQMRQTFTGVTINDRLDLAPRSNFRPRSSAGIEFVVQLPVVNAPFRIYWAYNFNRYSTIIQEPIGAVAIGPDGLPLDPATRALFPPNVYDFQVRPQLETLVSANARRLNFFEPLKTFRFTVSRTF